MKVIITVIGKDKVGIIAAVSGVLAENGVNILDISQTIMSEYFTMIMHADISNSALTQPQLQQRLEEVGNGLGLRIVLQHEDIFNTMHRI